MARITIEICGPHNEQYAWPVTQDSLRGRWSAARVAHHDKSAGLKALSALEHIPGLYVWIDTRAKACGIYDPLGFDEKGEPVSEAGRRAWAQIEQINARNPTAFTKSKPWDPMVQTDINADQAKEWMYWMGRAVEGRHAVYADGSQQLPTVAEIVKLPGRIRNEAFNTGQKGRGIPQHVFVVEQGQKTSA